MNWGLFKITLKNYQIENSEYRGKLQNQVSRVDLGTGKKKFLESPLSSDLHVSPGANL